MSSEAERFDDLEARVQATTDELIDQAEQLARFADSIDMADPPYPEHVRRVARTARANALAVAFRLRRGEA